MVLSDEDGAQSTCLRASSDASKEKMRTGCSSNDLCLQARRRKLALPRSYGTRAIALLARHRPRRGGAHMTLSVTPMDAHARRSEVAVQILESQRPMKALMTNYEKQRTLGDNIVLVERSR